MWWVVDATPRPLYTRETPGTHCTGVLIKSLARPGRKHANVSVRMAWISFGALPCSGKLASRCCWNRARPWHDSELVTFLVGLRTYQHLGGTQGRSGRVRKIAPPPPTGILYPDGPTCRESLYRLSYSGSLSRNITCRNQKDIRASHRQSY